MKQTLHSFTFACLKSARHSHLMLPPQFLPPVETHTLREARRYIKNSTFFLVAHLNTIGALILPAPGSMTPCARF